MFFDCTKSAPHATRREEEYRVGFPHKRDLVQTFCSLLGLRMSNSSIPGSYVKTFLPSPTIVNIDTMKCLVDVEDDDFLHLASGWAERSPSAILLSGGEVGHKAANRYSIAACDPLVLFESKGALCTVRIGSNVPDYFKEDPLGVLDRLCSELKPSFALEVPPFSGGAIGYLAYDLKNMIERLPASATDDLNLPDLFLFWPRRIMVHDRKEKKLSDIVLGIEGEGFEPRVRNDPTHSAVRTPLRTGSLHSSFTHEDYLKSVGKVRDYIGKGDVYQVNLSQRFHFDFEGDPFQLWKSLFEMNPSPFYAYINAGDHQVLSTSMERFLFRGNDFIETRPIKGTRRRGKTAREDRELASELVQSPKDDAELSMIVDLLRNDLGRVCRARSVRVAEHKMLETYGNVHHLVSVVSGELEPRVTNGDLIRATFPGGSITGCPKIRAMEIIDELEPCVRHVYTGSVGYLGWHDNMDLNVAIRTAIVKQESTPEPPGACSHIVESVSPGPKRAACGISGKQRNTAVANLSAPRLSPGQRRGSDSDTAGQAESSPCPADAGRESGRGLTAAIVSAAPSDGGREAGGSICYFSVGGGIVYDSDEEEEYQETLHKGRTLFELIEKIGGAA
ncbi:MAG: anthranilate synthase component I family protein [Syntrophobacteraceae bacterium]